MSTHNIQLHDKIRKFPLTCDFWNYRKNFVGTQKQVRISHGKRAIGVRAIEVRLQLFQGGSSVAILHSLCVCGSTCILRLLSLYLFVISPSFCASGRLRFVIVAFPGYRHFYYTNKIYIQWNLCKRATSETDFKQWGLIWKGDCLIKVHVM